MASDNQPSSCNAESLQQVKLQGKLGASPVPLRLAPMRRATRHHTRQGRLRAVPAQFAVLESPPSAHCHADKQWQGPGCTCSCLCCRSSKGRVALSNPGVRSQGLAHGRQASTVLVILSGTCSPATLPPRQTLTRALWQALYWKGTEHEAVSFQEGVTCSVLLTSTAARL